VFQRHRRRSTCATTTRSTPIGSPPSSRPGIHEWQLTSRRGRRVVFITTRISEGLVARHREAEIRDLIIFEIWGNTTGSPPSWCKRAFEDSDDEKMTGYPGPCRAHLRRRGTPKRSIPGTTASLCKRPCFHTITLDRVNEPGAISRQQPTPGCPNAIDETGVWGWPVSTTTSTASSSRGLRGGYSNTRRRSVSRRPDSRLALLRSLGRRHASLALYPLERFPKLFIVGRTSARNLISTSTQSASMRVRQPPVSRPALAIGRGTRRGPRRTPKPRWWNLLDGIPQGFLGNADCHAWVYNTRSDHRPARRAHEGATTKGRFADSRTTSISGGAPALTAGLEFGIRRPDPAPIQRRDHRAIDVKITPAAITSAVKQPRGSRTPRARDRAGAPNTRASAGEYTTPPPAMSENVATNRCRAPNAGDGTHRGPTRSHYNARLSARRVEPKHLHTPSPGEGQRQTSRSDAGLAPFEARPPRDSACRSRRYPPGSSNWSSRPAGDLHRRAPMAPVYSTRLPRNIAGSLNG